MVKQLSAMSALRPRTDVGRRIQVCSWLSVYEYTPYREKPRPLLVLWWLGFVSFGAEHNGGMSVRFPG